MRKIERSISVTRFGPWAAATATGVKDAANLQVFTDPQINGFPALRGYSHRAKTSTSMGRAYDTTGGGMHYSGDAIVYSDGRLPSMSFDTAPERFNVLIGARVQSEAPNSSMETFDAAGQTWRSITTAAIGHIQTYLQNAPLENAASLADVTALRKPASVPDAQDEAVMFEGKSVALITGFHECQEYLSFTTTEVPKLRQGELLTTPPITAKPWSGTTNFWNGDVEMRWTKAPKTRVEVEIPCVWMERVAQWTVYPKSKAIQLQTAYEAARDAHNTLLENATFKASKGTPPSSAGLAALEQRPAASMDPFVEAEGDEWWGKVGALIAELKRVQPVSGLTDENVGEKFPHGAGGKNLDELQKHIAQERANGNTGSTQDILDGLGMPTDQKENKPWWDRVLDSLDGLGAGVKDVLKDWGPMGTVGAYGGIKAVNDVSKGGSTWLWIALLAGGAFLLLNRSPAAATPTIVQVPQPAQELRSSTRDRRAERAEDALDY